MNNNYLFYDFPFYFHLFIMMDSKSKQRENTMFQLNGL